MGTKTLVASKAEKERITFYLRKDLVKELDKCAKSVYMNRSNFLEWLLVNALPMTKKVAKAMENAFKTVKPPEMMEGEAT